IAGGFLWYINRPKRPEPRNTTAIKATFYFVNAETNGTPHLEFNYVLDNTTDSDYALENDSSIKLMPRIEKDNSLLHSFEGIRLQCPAFIPAKQRTVCVID